MRDRKRQSILGNLEALAHEDPNSHGLLLCEILSQAADVTESGCAAVTSGVVVETLKAARIGPWIEQMRHQIDAGKNAQALATLNELEDWLWSVWAYARRGADQGKTVGRRRCRFSSADLEFLKALGVSKPGKKGPTV